MAGLREMPWIAMVHGLRVYDPMVSKAPDSFRSLDFEPARLLPGSRDGIFG